MDKFRKKLKEYIENYVFRIFPNLVSPTDMEQLSYALDIFERLEFREEQIKSREAEK